MNALIAEVAVPVTPEPVPVVVKAILSERMHGSRSDPEVVIDAFRNAPNRCPANGVSPFVAEASRHVIFADVSIAQLLHGLTNGRRRSALRAVLNDTVVAPGGRNELFPFPNVVGTRLLDIDILAGLAAPDRHQRMPVIWRRPRD